MLSASATHMSVLNRKSRMSCNNEHPQRPMGQTSEEDMQDEAITANSVLFSERLKE
jgi:hypothetical protein